jgi:proteic killer suppression protein
VIKSFRDRDTQKLFSQANVTRFASFQGTALRRLAQLAAATTLGDLKGPGLQLEKLKGDRVGQHSIRINQRWRVCFIWKGGHAESVEITDYH